MYIRHLRRVPRSRSAEDQDVSRDGDELSGGQENVDLNLRSKWGIRHRKISFQWLSAAQGFIFFSLLSGFELLGYHQQFEKRI